MDYGFKIVSCKPNYIFFHLTSQDRLFLKHSWFMFFLKLYRVEAELKWINTDPSEMRQFIGWWRKKLRSPAAPAGTSPRRRFFHRRSDKWHILREVVRCDSESSVLNENNNNRKTNRERKCHSTEIKKKICFEIYSKKN